jgi:hypothetical protein
MYKKRTKHNESRGFGPVAAMTSRLPVETVIAVMNVTRQMTDRTESGVRLLAISRISGAKTRASGWKLGNPISGI